MRTLESIRKDSDGDAAVSPGRAVRARMAGEKTMGFGYCLYQAEDPRATHPRQMSGELPGSGDRWW